jgi:hypothetical protein
MSTFPPSDDFDHGLVTALEHPVRVRFLELLFEQESLTPRQALPLLQDPALRLSQVTYHVHLLHRLRLIERAGERERDGGTPFRATPRGETALAMLGVAPREEDPG